MTALVAKADISGTPSRATANAGFGSLWEFIDERLATGDATAAEKAATRLALEAGRTMSALEATVASNALTIAIKPSATEFRSSTLSSGDVSMLANAGDLTVVVPSGATLGSTNGVLTRLAILEINNAGTKEAAVVNLAGGVDISETGVISTTTISTGADSANVVYSTTGRTNVPYRIKGYVEYTQATAGTYATAPSLVNPSSAPLALWLSGYGQTWQNVGGSRTAGVTYTNLTGRKITVNIENASASNAGISATADGAVFVGTPVNTGGNGSRMTISFPVQPGGTYVVTNVGGFQFWSELR